LRVAVGFGLAAGEQSCSVTALQLESATRAEEMAGEFEVGYLGEDGLERRLPLGESWATRFEDGLPVRRFASRKGQRHLSGLRWSATMSRHVGFESWLERDTAGPYRGPRQLAGYRVGVASAARMASSPAGWPFSFEYGPYGVPHTGVPVACRQLSASGPASTTLYPMESMNSVTAASTAGRIAAPPTRRRTTSSILDSIPPEALMRFRFIRPGNMAQAIACQLQPVASELIPALRETTAVERGRSRTGERS
jgi:hypothetical protein